MSITELYLEIQRDIEETRLFKIKQPEFRLTAMGKIDNHHGD